MEGAALGLGNMEKSHQIRSDEYGLGCTWVREQGKVSPNKVW